MKDTDIWEALPFACILSTKEGFIIDINSMGESFLNIAKTQSLHKSLKDLLRVEFDILDYFGNFSKFTSKSRFRDILIKVNEKIIITDMCVVSFKDDFLIIFYPVDNNTFNKAVLSESASQSVVSMAEMLGHEIKNPIAGITGAAQLLEMTVSSNDRKLTRLIVDETKRIICLIDQFDKFGDLRKPKFDTINIHDILEKTKKLSKVNSINNISIDDFYDPSLPEIFGDRVQLEQVFINLIDNAMNALKDVKLGIITFRTFYQKGLIVRAKDGTKRELPLQIQIEDNGPGIAENLIDKIFDPFISGSNNGTGLGLSLVLRIILAHNGMINASRDGNKTIFKISLPIVQRRRS